MAWDDIVIFTLLALLAEVIGTISGFGSSVFFVPIASMYFDFYSVLGITALFHLFSNISKITLFRKGIDKMLLLYLGVPAVLFVILGAYLSDKMQTEVLLGILSLFLIGFSAVFLIFNNLKIESSKRNAVVGGTLSGFIAGLVGTGGAIRGMTLSAFRLQKDVFIATSAFIDFAVDASRSVVYYTNGFVHKHDLPYVGILFFVSIIGTYTGKRVLNFISEEWFKRIVLFVILGIGVATLVKYLIEFFSA